MGDDEEENVMKSKKMKMRKRELVEGDSTIEAGCAEEFSVEPKIAENALVKSSKKKRSKDKSHAAQDGDSADVEPVEKKVTSQNFEPVQNDEVHDKEDQIIKKLLSKAAKKKGSKKEGNTFLHDLAGTEQNDDIETIENENLRAEKQLSKAAKKARSNTDDYAVPEPTEENVLNNTEVVEKDVIGDHEMVKKKRSKRKRVRTDESCSIDPIEEGAPEQTEVEITTNVSKKKNKKRRKNVEQGDSEPTEKNVSDNAETGGKDEADGIESAKKKKSKTKRVRADESGSIDRSETQEDDGTKETSARNKPEGVIVEPANLVLGGFPKIKKPKVIARLPRWLANPVTFSANLTQDSVDIEVETGLDEEMIATLKQNGITHFFPTQFKVIPWILSKYEGSVNDANFQSKAPGDVCIAAPTGSGKTLCYVLPIIQILKKRFVPKVRALVVVPTRELAEQVQAVFRKYTRCNTLTALAITGGKNTMDAEKKSLVKNQGINLNESNVDILVTTPGRLVEHLHQTTGFDLTHLKFLVIDEADRTLENIQDNWVTLLQRHISPVGNQSLLSLKSVKEKSRFPQVIMCSATLTRDPEVLKTVPLFQPTLFATGPAKHGGTGSRSHKEKYIVSYMSAKPLIICELIRMGWKKMLCFVNTIDDAHKLTLLMNILAPEFSVREFTAKIPMTEREKTLNDFSAGHVHLLVCSDVMARGIDIPEVSAVINYDPPKHINGYIHRSGRTARAGSGGTVLTLLTEEQVPRFLTALREANITHITEMKMKKTTLTMDDFKSAVQLLKNRSQRETAREAKKLKLRKRAFLGARSMSVPKKKHFPKKKKKTSHF